MATTKTKKRSSAKAAPSHTASSAFMNTREAATFLGFNKNVLEQWRSNQTPNTPPFVKIGGSVRYSREDLAKWLKDRLKKY
jgi:predicted DNA-binding transcriptional regulator AlpA